MEIIAEIGQNYNGDMKLAHEMIHCAKESGADVAKFQVFDADAVFGKVNNSWYEYNCKTQLTRDQVYVLYEECRKADIEFLATPFDAERVSWLEEIGTIRYKIASRSINDKNLVTALENTKKPLIISLGMWQGVKFPEINTNTQVDYLFCVSKYPTELSDLNFESVDFNRYSGFSDHTLGITAALVALSRGAKIIEKHFTLDKEMYGPDHAGSMTPDELKELNRFKMEIAHCF